MEMTKKCNTTIGQYPQIYKANRVDLGGGWKKEANPSQKAINELLYIFCVLSEYVSPIVQNGYEFRVANLTFSIRSTLRISILLQIIKINIFYFQLWEQYNLQPLFSITQSSKIIQPMSEEKKDFLVKVIVIGDSGVGKTNLLTRYCQNNFKDTYVATIGVDFKIKSVMVNDKKIKMQIWDTAGQDRFQNITKTYFKGASGIVLAYSVTDAQSFSHIKRWMQQIQTNAPENVCKILVGTKQDLQAERVVSIEAGQHLAENNQKNQKIPFMEVSAKSGYQVKEAFELLARQMERKQPEGEAFKSALHHDKREMLKNNAAQQRGNCAC